MSLGLILGSKALLGGKVSFESGIAVWWWTVPRENGCMRVAVRVRWRFLLPVCETLFGPTKPAAHTILMYGLIMNWGLGESIIYLLDLSLTRVFEPFHLQLTLFFITLSKFFREVWSLDVFLGFGLNFVEDDIRRCFCDIGNVMKREECQGKWKATCEDAFLFLGTTDYGE